MGSTNRLAQLKEMSMKIWLEDSYWQRARRISIAERNNGDDMTAAASSLEAIPGVIAAAAANNCIYVEYDLRQINLPTIRSTIMDHTLTVRENPWERLSRWISEYKDAVRCEEQHIDFGWDAWIQAAYVNRYRLRRHGKRDDRVTNWRQYELPKRTNDHQTNSR